MKMSSWEICRGLGGNGVIDLGMELFKENAHAQFEQ